MDIASGLSILADRAKGGNEVTLVSPPDGAEKLGQNLEIDWARSPSCPCNPLSSSSPPLTPTPPSPTSTANNDALKAHLSKLDHLELIKSVLRAQEERSSTYKTFEASLNSCLRSSDFSKYGLYGAQATAQFSVLSNTINTISEVLLNLKSRTDLVSFISKLQAGEKEKLKLTAALHLDRIRLACEADEKIKLLLTTSVADLRSKIVGSVEIICEELDELKSILVEESIERC